MNKNHEQASTTERNPIIITIREIITRYPFLAPSLCVALSLSSIAFIFDNQFTVQAQGTIPPPRPPAAEQSRFVFDVTDQEGERVPGSISAEQQINDLPKEKLNVRDQLKLSMSHTLVKQAPLPGETQIITFTIESNEGELLINTSAQIPSTVSTVLVSDGSVDQTGYNFSVANSNLSDDTVSAAETNKTTITSLVNNNPAVQSIKITAGNPLGGAVSVEIADLETGFVRLDVQQAELINVSAASSDFEPRSIASFSGKSGGGVDLKLSVDGESYVINSEQPLEGNETHEILLNSNETITLSGIDQNGDEEDDTFSKDGELVIPGIVTPVPIFTLAPDDEQPVPTKTPQPDTELDEQLWLPIVIGS